MSSALRDVRRSVSSLMLASVSSSSVGRRNARCGGLAVNTHIVEIAGCNYQSSQLAEGFDWRVVGESACHRAQVPGLIYNHGFSVLDLESYSFYIRWSRRKKHVFFTFFERRRSRSVFGRLLNKPVRDYTVFDFSRYLRPGSFMFDLPDPGLIRIYIGFRSHRIF
jgi:hypothetical protein